MIHKIILALGVVMAGLAAEGLNRFGGLVAALGGTDAELYLAFLLLSLIAIVVLILALFIALPGAVKWVMLMALVIASGLMLFAPNFPVTVQIVVGLIGAAVAMLAVPVRQAKI